jgi:hypothetical protein
MSGTVLICFKLPRALRSETKGSGSSLHTLWQAHLAIVQTVSAQSCPHMLPPVRKGVDFSSRIPDQNASKDH